MPPVSIGPRQRATRVYVYTCVHSRRVIRPSQSRRCEPQGRAPFGARGGEIGIRGRPGLLTNARRAPAFALKHVLIDRINLPTHGAARLRDSRGMQASLNAIISLLYINRG